MCAARATAFCGSRNPTNRMRILHISGGRDSPPQMPAGSPNVCHAIPRAVARLAALPSRSLSCRKLGALLWMRRACERSEVAVYALALMLRMNSGELLSAHGFFRLATRRERDTPRRQLPLYPPPKPIIRIPKLGGMLLLAAHLENLNMMRHAPPARRPGEPPARPLRFSPDIA